ncbi:hypothetical protein F4818DRAFT_445240 [Hypoxylon cercidicola]|nr:hypothetical protein F4818DRAFT_445240 [Hypoxylon cercidicola]
MSASHGTSIQQYRLERAPTEEEPVFGNLMPEYMGAVVRTPISWKYFTINKDAQLITEYTVTVVNRAYLTSAINLWHLQQPKMKHRDMIVGNYKTAKGHPDETGWFELNANNVFLHGQRKKLLEYQDEFFGATIDKVVVVASATPAGVDMHALHMLFATQVWVAGPELWSPTVSLMGHMVWKARLLLA